MTASPDDPLSRLEALHTTAAIRERIAAGPTLSYLRDFVYGAVDGAVTTFAVVTGVAGAELPSRIVLILGVANLVGDGFSMAASNYLGTRAERQLIRRRRTSERLQITTYPEGERAEVREIYRQKGFEGADLDRVTDVITSDTDRWIDTMMKEEHGMLAVDRSPFRAAVATLAAFVIVGLVPLLAYVANWIRPQIVDSPFHWSCALTGLAFFATGALKGRFVAQRWPMAGAETLLVGGAAATLAWSAGALLGNLARS